jgi:hypothetical protein
MLLVWKGAFQVGVATVLVWNGAFLVWKIGRLAHFFDGSNKIWTVKNGRRLSCRQGSGAANNLRLIL